MLRKITILSLLTLAATGTACAATQLTESHRAVVNYAPIDWHEAFKVTKKENALLNKFLAQYEFPTLDQDPDAIHAINGYGLTILHYAAAMGHAEVTALLLARGADVNARNNYGYTPLHYAALKGHTEVAAVLLKHGADIHAKDNSGETPFDVAKSNGNTACAELLRTSPQRRCSIQ